MDDGKSIHVRAFFRGFACWIRRWQSGLIIRAKRRERSGGMQICSLKPGLGLHALSRLSRLRSLRDLRKEAGSSRDRVYDLALSSICSNSRMSGKSARDEIIMCRDDETNGERNLTMERMNCSFFALVNKYTALMKCSLLCN